MACVYIDTNYGGLHTFDSPAWDKANFSCFYLCEVFGVNDKFYLETLNALREEKTSFVENKKLIYAEKSIASSNLNTIRKCVTKDIDHDAICLCGSNDEADQINDTALTELNTPIDRIQGLIQGKFPYDMFPVDSNLDLAVGAKVIFKVNDPNHAYKIGDIGTVVNMSYGNPLKLEVELIEDGRIINVIPVVWVYVEYQLEGNKPVMRMIGRYLQLPISLGWAISIEKSKGVNLRKVHLVLGDRKYFHLGELYTALNRVKSFDNLTVDRMITVHDIRVDPLAQDFYEKL